MGANKNRIYYCKSCGYETYKWMGKCPDCQDWNSMEEKPQERIAGSRKQGPGKALLMGEVEEDTSVRIPSGIQELDRVLGGGAVKGSALLLGGDPGVGKSTLMLQVASKLAVENSVLFISGEESLGQMKMRSQRLHLHHGDFWVAAETEYQAVADLIEKHHPQVLIIDSIQSIYYHQSDGLPGSVSQVKEVTYRLLHLTKEMNMVLLLVGHVTKEGSLAGPKLLEHMVDGVFYLEGDRFQHFRLLRGAKNRFGATNELGVFLMGERGLEPVADPSYLFVTESDQNPSGSTVAVSMEGSRPLLVELQSLVNASSYASPRRTSAGIDLNRVALIMAVLEKHGGLSFYGLDTFVNVVGGVRLVETAMDLPLALSLASSVRQRPLDKTRAVFGEISLTGEVRPVGGAASRVKEAQKLGLQSCLLPKKNLEELTSPQFQDMDLVGISTLGEALELC